MRNRSPANSDASSPPVPARISRITFFSSLGSRGVSSSLSFSSTASRFFCSVGISALASSRKSASSPSRIDLCPAISSAMRIYSRAQCAASVSCDRSLASRAYSRWLPRVAGSLSLRSSSATRSSIALALSSIAVHAPQPAASGNKNGAAVAAVPMDSPPRTRVRRAPQTAGVAMLLFGGSFRRLLGRLLDAVLAIEPLDAPRGIDQALRASVKRMALRADLDVKLFDRRARFEGVAAGTNDRAAAVFRMDSSFHFCFSNSATYCIAGYHRKVSHTIRPMRLPFQAFRIAFVTLAAAIIITICAITTYAASSPAPAAPTQTAANPGFAADSRTLFAPIVYLSPPGPARASRAIAIFDRQLDFQRKISFHPKLAPALQDVLVYLPPRQSTMIRAAALYAKPEIPWRDGPGGTHQICVAGRPDDTNYLYSLVDAWRSPEEPARFSGVFGLKPATDSTPDDISSVTGTLAGELMIDTYGIGALIDAFADLLREFHGDLKAPWDSAPGAFDHHDRAAMDRFHRQMPHLAAKFDHYFKFNNLLDEFNSAAGPIVLFNVDMEVRLDALKKYP